MSDPYSQQPIEFISQITTMNPTDDPTSLKENEAVLIQNFTKESGVLEVRTGKTLLNTGNLLPAACLGLSTFDPLDSDTPQYVAVSNATLRAGSAFPLTEIKTGLSASTLMRLLPFNGKMLINDPSQGMLWYDGTSAGWCGVPSPRENKLIEDYETVTGWSVVNGAATLDDTTVIHGRHGIKFKADAGLTYSPRRTISSINLNIFPSLPAGDAAVSGTKDYIRIQLTRSFKADFTSLDLILQSSAGNWSYARLSDMKEWNNFDGAGLVFDLFIRKGEFQAGAGTLDWTAITQTGFDIIAAAGKQPYIVVDWLRLERAGPYAQEMGKKIGDFESDETWVEAAATVSYEYKYKISLSRALKLAGSGASAYRDFSPALDLTTLDNGTPADTIDAIEIYLARNTAKVEGTIRISLYDGAVTAYYDINAEDILTPRIGGTPMARIKDPALVYQPFAIRKDQFTNYATLTWSSIDRVTLTSSAHAGTYYIDSVRLVKSKDFKTVVAFEPTETPTVTGTSQYGWADPNKDPYRSDEGSTTSLFVHIGASSECTIDFAFSPDLDLSQYASGASTQDSDVVGPYIWMSRSDHIDEISMLYDSNDGSFTDYYIKQLLRSASQIPDIKKNWFKARFEKREHEQMPSTAPTGNWANICKVRLKIVTNKAWGGVDVYIDQWLMSRGISLTGVFWYKITYRNQRGSRSDDSNPSNRVEVRGANVMLTDIPTSSGCLREVWRIGGASSDWRLAGIIGDDEATYFEDFILEEDLGEILPPTHEAPKICKTFCLHDNFVIRGNLTEMSGGYRHKTLIEIGIEESIDEVDSLSSFDVGKEDGYEILAVMSFLDRVYIFKEKGVWSFDPYNLDQRPICHSRELGILNPFSWCIDPKGILYFLSSDKDLYSFNGQTFSNLFNTMGYYLDLIPDAYIHRPVMEFFDAQVLISIPQTGETANSLVLIYDTEGDGWSIASGWPTSIFHVKSYSGATSLIGGTGADGKLFTYFSGDTDDGSVIVGVIRTADRSADPTITKQPATLYLLARKLTATDASLRIEPYYDQIDSTDNLDYSVTSTTFAREESGCPSPTYWPTYLGWKLTTSLGRLAISSLAYSMREELRR